MVQYNGFDQKVITRQLSNPLRAHKLIRSIPVKAECPVTNCKLYIEGKGCHFKWALKG